MGNGLGLFENEKVAVIKNDTVLGKDFCIYGTKEEPLFLAKDVAQWIEHSNSRMMLQSVDEDEKVVKIAYTLGGAQEQLFLTENGLYEVLMQSRKPIAKEFKKEVKKVLHSLRVNGGYIAHQEDLSDEELIAKALVTAQKIIANKEKQIAQMQPLAAGYKLTMDADGTYSMAETAKLLKLSYGNKKLFAQLRNLGILDKNNVPFQEYINRNYFIVVTKPVAIGDKVENKVVTRVTAKGMDFVAKKLGILTKAA